VEDCSDEQAKTKKKKKKSVGNCLNSSSEKITREIKDTLH
jgi:hypothetical protein